MRYQISLHEYPLHAVELLKRMYQTSIAGCMLESNLLNPGSDMKVLFTLAKFELAIWSTSNECQHNDL